jgi:hypothetical protein
MILRTNSNKMMQMCLQHVCCSTKYSVTGDLVMFHNAFKFSVISHSGFVNVGAACETHEEGYR